MERAAPTSVADLFAARAHDRGDAPTLFSFRDPIGYVFGLTARRPNHEEVADPAANGARATLDAWQRAKSTSH